MHGAAAAVVVAEAPLADLGLRPASAETGQIADRISAALRADIEEATNLPRAQAARAISTFRVAAVLRDSVPHAPRRLVAAHSESICETAYDLAEAQRLHPASRELDDIAGPYAASRDPFAEREEEFQARLIDVIEGHLATQVNDFTIQTAVQAHAR